MKKGGKKRSSFKLGASEFQRRVAKKKCRSELRPENEGRIITLDEEDTQICSLSKR